MEKKTLSIKVDVDLWRAIKLASIKRGTTLSKFVENAVKKEINEEYDEVLEHIDSSPAGSSFKSNKKKN